MLIDESELLYGDVTYEKRAVCFFDVLGWRNEIESTGTDPRRIARLAAFARLFQAALLATGDRNSGAQLSTFSDCVVFSAPFVKSALPVWAKAFAGIQLSLAWMGFWVRGALTIGDLFHDSMAVFGPALNRAYALETESAVYPRIIFDPLTETLQNFEASYVSRDETFSYLDPFSITFINEWRRTPIDPSFTEQFSRISGTALPIQFPSVSDRVLLESVYYRLLFEAQNAPSSHVLEKFTWLIGVIGPRLAHSPT